MRSIIALGCLAILLAGRADVVDAQARLSVQGRVTDPVGDTPVALAGVELEGHGTTLTTAEGYFSFEGVSPGAYTLRVVAFGYAPVSEFLVVDDDLTIGLAMQAAPVLLDPVIATIRPIDLRGTVLDPENEMYLVGAEVLTNQGQVSETDAHGIFRLRRVLEEIPLQVSVRSFGYLPLDTVIVPRRGERPRFELHPDEVVEAQIAVQVERLERRHAPHFAPMFRSMNRHELLRYAGSHTLGTVLEFRYWRYVDRIRAVVVDGRQVAIFEDPAAELSHILPEEIERIEFSGGKANTVLRVYTRDFMRRLLTQEVTLSPDLCEGGAPGDLVSCLVDPPGRTMP